MIILYNSESQVYEIDSVFGNRNASFDLKVYQLTYYLSTLILITILNQQRNIFQMIIFMKKDFMESSP